MPGDYMLPIRIESVSIFGISSTNDVYLFDYSYSWSAVGSYKLDDRGEYTRTNGEGSGNGVPSCALVR